MIRYKVRHIDFQSFVIDCYEDGLFPYQLEEEFKDIDMVERFCRILNEETREAYLSGQASNQ